MSDETHACPVEECGYTTGTKQGVNSHIGASHSDDVVKSVLVDEVQRLADELGRTPTQKSMDELGEFSTNAYQNNFGTWNAALEAAGLNQNRRTDFSEEDLLDELRNIECQIGRTPTQDDISELGDFYAKTYIDYFGSWNGALEAAGLDVVRRTNLSEETLLKELRRLEEEVERTPTQHDMSELGEFSLDPYIRCFGSWIEALDQIGLEPEYNTTISDEELLEEVQKLADELGHTPRIVDMREHGRFSPSIYQRRFGGWNATVISLGLEPNDRSREKTPSDDLLNELRRLARELDRTPSQSDMRKHGEFGPTIYHDRFGNWNAAVHKIGLEPNQRNDHTEEEILSELRRLARELGRVPSVVDMNEMGAFSQGVYYTMYSGWNAALEAAGLTPGKRYAIPDEDLIDELQRLGEKYGRAPGAKEMYEEGTFSDAVYYNRFGSWPEAVDAAGLEPRTAMDWVPSGSDSPYWNGGQPRYYGPNWTQQRRYAIERDGEKCVICELSREDHFDDFGRDLNVHHKRPLATFPFVDDQYNRDWEAANALSNLLTCCVGCHSDLDDKAREKYPADEYPRYIMPTDTSLKPGQAEIGDFA